VAARSKAAVGGRTLAGIMGSNPTGAWMSVSCECYVLSGRGLCVGLITRPWALYRVWCVWDREAWIMRIPGLPRAVAPGKQLRSPYRLCMPRVILMNQLAGGSSGFGINIMPL